MNIKLSEKETVFLKQYAEVYKHERDIDCTCDPIVVVEDIDELVALDGYGDTTVYAWGDSTYYSLDELKKDLRENGYSKREVAIFCDDLEYQGNCKDGEIKKFSVHRRYYPRAYFLTRVEAERYVKYQSHNLREPRVYTRSCGYANYGDLQCLYQLLLKMGQQLNQ
jgi:hypothetical protein